MSAPAATIVVRARVVYFYINSSSLEFIQLLSSHYLSSCLQALWVTQ